MPQTAHILLLQRSLLTGNWWLCFPAIEVILFNHSLLQGTTSETLSVIGSFPLGGLAHHHMQVNVKLDWLNVSSYILIAHYKVFSDDESLTAIKHFKEPIKRYQHNNISNNELDNKVDWHWPIRAQLRLSYPNCIGQVISWPAYKDLCHHGNKKLNEGQSPCVLARRNPGRQSRLMVRLSFNQRARVQDPRLTIRCPWARYWIPTDFLGTTL